MNTQNARVLIADDDGDERNLLSSLVENKYKCEILQAKDGLEVLRIILKESPDLDLLILDMAMPYIDGLDVLNIIKKNSQLKNLSVIACTAQSTVPEVQQICRYGVADYIVKPVTKPILYSKLGQYLQKKNRFERLTEEAT